MKTLKITIGLLVLIAMLSGTPTIAQSFDNMGKDFVIGFLPNHSDGPDCELHLTAEIATDVTIEYPYNAPTFTTTVAVTPGNITVVSLPSAVADAWTFGAAHNNNVHAFAEREFICYMVNRLPYTSDAALALPTDVMGKEFIVATYRHGGGEFVVVAAYPGTEVTINPTNNLVGGYTAGVPFTITLNVGEGFLAKAAEGFGPTTDLSGTIVTSTRAIGLTNGNLCTYIPPEYGTCDHIFEVAQAVQTWGTRIFCANLPNRTGGSVYRILGSEDGTSVTMDGVPLVTLNRGDVYETGIIPGNHIIEGSKPIFVVQFMTGIETPGNSTGDPAMGNLAPSEQYLSRYTFSTVGAGQFTENFVTIVAHNDDVGLLTLDAVPVDASNYTAIGSSDFSAAVIPLTEGVHTTFSPDSTHGITIEGFNHADSYIYPGGAMFIPIPPGTGDTTAPICELIYDDCMAFGTATDVGDSITGIFGVQLDPGSVNLDFEYDSSFIPGDTVVQYTVSLINPNLPGSGVITVIDNVGLTCQSVIEIDCDSQPTQPSLVVVPNDCNTVINARPFYEVIVDAPHTETRTKLVGFGDVIVSAIMGTSDFDVREIDVTTLKLQGMSTIISDTVMDIGTASLVGAELCDCNTLGPDGYPDLVFEINSPFFILAPDSVGYGDVLEMKAEFLLLDSTSMTLSDCVLLEKGGRFSGSSTLTEVTTEVTLESNFPNPFNPSTVIQFSMPEASYVVLDIFNITGQKITTLIDATLEAGHHAIEWDGSHVASGIYLYRIKVGDVSISKKMLLLK